MKNGIILGIIGFIVVITIGGFIMRSHHRNFRRDMMMGYNGQNYNTQMMGGNSKGQMGRRNGRGRWYKWCH